MRKLFIPLIFISFSACLSPSNVDLTLDKDMVTLDSILNFSDLNYQNLNWKKTVTLDGKEEKQAYAHDSLILKLDLDLFASLSFAGQVQPASHPKTVSKDQLIINYRRNDKETNGPVSLKLHKNSLGEISQVEILLERENFLYQSTKEVQLVIIGSVIQSYNISNTRNLIGLVPSIFQVEAFLINP